MVEEPTESVDKERCPKCNVGSVITEHNRKHCTSCNYVVRKGHWENELVFPSFDESMRRVAELKTLSKMREGAKTAPAKVESALPSQEVLVKSARGPATTKCPRCGRADSIVHDPMGGEDACGICGYVSREKIADSGPDWKAFTKEEKEARVRAGPPTTLARSDRGLTTLIDRSRKDANGNDLSFEAQARIKRLQWWNTRNQAMGTGERKMNRAFQIIDDILEGLGLGNNNTARENSAKMWRDLYAKKIAGGKRSPQFEAAVVYETLDRMHATREYDDVWAATNSPSCVQLRGANSGREWTRTPKKSFKAYVRLIRLELPAHEEEQEKNGQRILREASRIASAARLEPQTERLGKDILNALSAIPATANTKSREGKDRRGVAAGALLIAIHLRGRWTSESLLAEAAGVTEVTVRTRHKEEWDMIVPYLDPEVLKKASLTKLTPVPYIQYKLNTLDEKSRAILIANIKSIGNGEKEENRVIMESMPATKPTQENAVQAMRKLTSV